MAVGVAVFTSSSDGLADPWPAYAFALGFGLVLLIRRRHPVLVLLLTSLGICVYYALQYPPIGLALPIAAALFSAAEAGHIRVGIIVSAVLVTLSLYFQIVSGQDVGQLLGYELPPVIALMGASLPWATACDPADCSRSRSGIGNARPGWSWSASRPSSETRSGSVSPATCTTRSATVWP